MMLICGVIFFRPRDGPPPPRGRDPMPPPNRGPPRGPPEPRRGPPPPDRYCNRLLYYKVAQKFIKTLSRN